MAWCRDLDLSSVPDAVAWCRDLELSSVPDAVLEVTRHCLLDWFTVTIAGAHEPLTGLLADEVEASEQGRRR